MKPRHPIAISSPGKVLVAGGYLVVDRAYTGLAFGLSARIHVHIEDQATSQQVGIVSITVRSPQFDAAEWHYTCTSGSGENSAVVVHQNEQPPAPRNKFVETVLQYALTYVSRDVSFSDLSSVAITIVADTAYYSHADTATRQPGTSSDSPFLKFNVSLSNAHKTGLGSSAALVTSLTAALLSHYLPGEAAPNLQADDGKKRVHNLAQLAHCSAQGKVGSGFDVAAAVYGSCEYKRFSPSVLGGLGEPSSSGFATRLVSLVDDADGSAWDTSIRSAGSSRMPAGLCLLMCDVDCGSETPGMVKQIFEWRKNDAENSDRIWTALQASNEQLGSLLLDGTKTEADGSDVKHTIRRTLESCRVSIREMSKLSGVPVEPPAQTALLNACSQVEGVLGGVVPGAGGYDAIVLVADDSEKTRARLSQCLEGYRAPEAKDGEPKIGKVSLLDVRQEMEGARSEDVKLYQGWTQTAS